MPLLLVAALPEVVIGAALLLLLYATQQFWVKPLVWTIQQIPVVGSQAADFVQNAAAAVVNWAVGWVEAGAGPIIQLLNVPAAALSSFAGSVVQAIEGLAAQVQGAGEGLIGKVNELTATVAQAFVAGTTALAQIVGLTAELAAAKSLMAFLQGTAIPLAQSSAIKASESYTDARAADVRAATLAATAAALATAERAVSSEATRARAAEATIAANATGEVGVLRAAIAGVQSRVEGEVGADVRTLERAIGDVTALVKPIAAAGLVTAVATIATEVETLKRECVDPTCDYLGPQLGNLNALGDIATLLALGGLVAAAYRDPEGAAKEAASLAGSFRDALNVVSGPLFGVTV